MNSPPPLSRMGRYMNVSEEGIINSAFLRKEFRGQKYNECERWAIEWVASCLRVGGCDYSLLQDLLQHLGHFHRRGKMILINDINPYGFVAVLKIQMPSFLT